MSKRGSGTPRRPRNPVAKAVRTPAFKTQVVPDKRWKDRLKNSVPPGPDPTGQSKDEPQ